MEKSEQIQNTIYLDTNFFVYLFTKEPEEVENILIYLKDFKIFTSCLTYDEFIWIIRKIHNKEASIKAAEFLLNLDFIYFIELNKTILNKSIEIMKQFNLKPRDVLHVSSMIIKNIKQIVTEDKDFDVIKSIKRYTIKEFLYNLKKSEEDIR